MSDALKNLVKQARNNVSVSKANADGTPLDGNFESKELWANGEVSETGAKVWKKRWFSDLESNDGFYEKLSSNISRNK